MGLTISIIILIILVIVGTIIARQVWELEGKGTAIVLAIFVVIASLITLGNWLANFRNDHVATCIVTSKDRGADDGSYRVYTSNCGVLGNKDTWLRAKVNSADIWEQIPQQGKITVEIAGTRIRVISKMPNIIRVVSVP